MTAPVALDGPADLTAWRIHTPPDLRQPTSQPAVLGSSLQFDGTIIVGASTGSPRLEFLGDPNVVGAAEGLPVPAATVPLSIF